MHTATDFCSVHKLKVAAALWRRLFCFRHVQKRNQYWSGGWPKIPQPIWVIMGQTFLYRYTHSLERLVTSVFVTAGLNWF